MDDPHGEAIVADTRASMLQYGILRRRMVRAEPRKGTWLWADVQSYAASGNLAFICSSTDRAGLRERVTSNTPLVGKHNVQNCLAAAGAAIGLGLPLEQVAAGLQARERGARKVAARHAGGQRRQRRDRAGRLRAHR